MQSDLNLVRFESPLNLRSIQPAHRTLLERLSSTQSVVVDVPDDAEADISFVQMMESARIYAHARGKDLALARPAGDAMGDVLRRAGFTDALTADRARFWFHEGEK